MIFIHNRFPRMIPTELKKVQKCRSYYISKQEVKVLNEINLRQCKGEYGTQDFNENDVVVELEEFRQFFDLVTDTVISRAAMDMGFTNGGWLQINNTVCYYFIMNRYPAMCKETMCNCSLISLTAAFSYVLCWLPMHCVNCQYIVIIGTKVSRSPVSGFSCIIEILNKVARPQILWDWRESIKKYPNTQN